MRRFIFVLVPCFVASIVHAQVVGLHQGANDPLSEGWQKIRSFAAVTTAPVLNDSGLGIDAWNISDTSNADGIYAIHLTPQQLQAAAVNDWSLSTRLRVVSGQPPIPTPDDASIHVAVHFTETRFSMVLGRNGNGVPWLGIPSNVGLSYILLGNIDSNYHTYELRYSHVDLSASFYLDGALKATGFYGAFDPDGNTGPNDRTSEYLFFGSTFSDGTSSTNYNLVQFTILPEPSVAGTAICAMSIIGCVRRRWCSEIF